MLEANRDKNMSRKEVVDYYTNKKNCDQKGECYKPKKSVLDAYDKDGYPLIKFDGKTRRLARLIVKEKYGDKKVTSDKVTIHSCNNSFCVRPSHLSVGTQEENMNSLLENRTRMPAKTFNWEGPIVDNDLFSFFPGAKIKSDSADQVVEHLQANDDNTAYIKISSPGGDIMAAKTIVAKLQPYQSRINFELVGFAASAGSYIPLAAANKIYIREGSMFLSTSQHFVHLIQWIDTF